MAIFVTLGWQLWGRDWSAGSPSVIPLPGQPAVGPIASLPPSVWCPEPPSIPWYVSHGAWALPLAMLINVNLNIRPRESLAPLACTLLGTLTAGFLSAGCTPSTCALPSDLQNVLTAFVTASAAELVEFHTGLSSVVCIVPALFIFAPGSAAMLALMGQLHRAAGEASYSSTSAYAANVATLWESITMNAVTYMLGVLLASQLWKGAMARRASSGAVVVRPLGAEVRPSRSTLASERDSVSESSEVGLGLRLVPSSRSAAQIDVDGIKGQGLTDYRAKSKKVRELREEARNTM